MLSLLNSSNWFAQYGLLIVLVVALVVLMLISFNRRKKEDTYRNELEQKVVPGAKVKTYYGLYGKVLKVTETTDGKIVLIETGDEKRTSYQEVHINAIYAIDEKTDVVLDENGNEVTPKTEEEKKFEELEKQLEVNENKEENKTTKKVANKKATSKKPAEKVVATTETIVEEPKVENKEKTAENKTATKKSASAPKKETTKKSNSTTSKK